VIVTGPPALVEASFEPHAARDRTKAAVNAKETRGSGVIAAPEDGRGGVATSYGGCPFERN
jgi:hypothetical protein